MNHLTNKWRYKGSSGCAAFLYQCVATTVNHVILSSVFYVEPKKHEQNTQINLNISAAHKRTNKQEVYTCTTSAFQSI